MDASFFCLMSSHSGISVMRTKKISRRDLVLGSHVKIVPCVLCDCGAAAGVPMT